MDVGSKIQSNNKVNVVISKYITGEIYKITTEFGIKYAYVFTDDGQLRRFELDKIKEI